MSLSQLILFHCWSLCFLSSEALFRLAHIPVSLPYSLGLLCRSLSPLSPFAEPCLLIPHCVSRYSGLMAVVTPSALFSSRVSCWYRRLPMGAYVPALAVFFCLLFCLSYVVSHILLSSEGGWLLMYSPFRLVMLTHTAVVLKRCFVGWRF